MDPSIRSSSTLRVNAEVLSSIPRMRNGTNYCHKFHFSLHLLISHCFPAFIVISLLPSAPQPSCRCLLSLSRFPPPPPSANPHHFAYIAQLPILPSLLAAFQFLPASLTHRHRNAAHFFRPPRLCYIPWQPQPVYHSLYRRELILPCSKKHTLREALLFMLCIFCSAQIHVPSTLLSSSPDLLLTLIC